MKKNLFLFGMVALLIMMVSCGQSARNRNADNQEATVAVDILSWPRMAANEFGCMMEQTFGHRDERFNCSLTDYVNKGNACYATEEYYEGPEFPKHLVRKVHPKLESISLSWEGGMLQCALLIFDKDFTEAEILSAIHINPDELPDNVWSMDFDENRISLVGFEHSGAGDMDCGEEMISEIFIGLPESVMPKYLKTKDQRNEADVFAAHRERNMQDYVPFEDNHLIKNNFSGDGTYDQWDMAVYYLADDDSKAVVIVRYGAGLDGFTLESDKTLLYDFKAKIFTEIERPMDPVTVDEVIDETLFESTALAAKAKAFWNKNKQIVQYNDFDRYGFTLRASLFGYDDSDYYGEQNSVEATRLWNGSRFVKGPRWYFTHPIEKRMNDAIEENPSTMGMIEAYAKAAKEWEAEIDKNYQILTERLGGRNADITKLQTAQKAYEAFNNFETQFNASYWNSFSGSMYTIFPAVDQADMRRHRAFQLAACFNHKAITDGPLGTNPESKTEEEWDKTLNDNYKALMEKLETDNQNRLQEAQRRWITYRDAEVDAYYSCCLIAPNPTYRLLLVRLRALHLKSYLDVLSGGFEENP